jgi:hypothetical protein
MLVTSDDRFVAYHFDRTARDCPGRLLEGDKHGVFVGDPLVVPSAVTCDVTTVGVFLRIDATRLTDPFGKNEDDAFETLVAFDKQ